MTSGRLIRMEGARRIKRLGQLILTLGSLAAIVLWLIFEFSGMAKVEPGEQLLFLLSFPVFFGGALWAGGWILMGGARRIKRLGQLILALGSLAAVALWLIVELNGMAKVGPVEQLLFLLLFPVFFGGVLWMGGWILEGFLQPPGHFKET